MRQAKSVIAPIFISLAVVVPATFGIADLITLTKRRPDRRRTRRDLTRRATILLAAAVAAAISIHYWRG